MTDFRSPLDSTQFDIYVLGRALRPDAKAPSTLGFLGLNLSAAEARAEASRQRQRGVATLVLPVPYRDIVGISLDEATSIALGEYERLTRTSTDKFGPLTVRRDGVGWWVFSANNISAQERGMIPGIVVIYIDKILARALTDDEIEEMNRLSFAQGANHGIIAVSKEEVPWQS